MLEELKPHFEAIKNKLREHPTLPHAARALLSVEGAELAVAQFDRREKYLAETLKPVKGTALVYLEASPKRPVRKQVLRITKEHIIVAWHEPRCPEHRFDIRTGISLEHPRAKNALPHMIALGELVELRQTGASLQR